MYSRFQDDHIEQVKLVFKLLEQHQLYMNRKKNYKCGKTQVAYLGHVISQKGVVVDKTKVQAIKEWPIPPNRGLTRIF